MHHCVKFFRIIHNGTLRNGLVISVIINRHSTCIVGTVGILGIVSIVMITKAFKVKSHCTLSMLKSKLIKLIFFRRKEVRLLYFGVTGFRSHISSILFTMPTMLVLCVHYTYYAYYAAMSVLCLLCLYYAHYAYYSTMLVLCLHYAYYACNMPTCNACTMPVYKHPGDILSLTLYSMVSSLGSTNTTVNLDKLIH